MALRNSEIANSYFATFQNGLVAGFLNFTANDFQAVKQTATLHQILPGHLITDPPIDINPIAYEAEVDPGGNFNLATEYYTCPVSGIYTFNFHLIFTNLCPFPFGTTNTFRAIIIDNAGNTLGETILNGIAANSVNIVTVSISIQRALGDQVGTRVTFNYATGNAATGQIRMDIQTKFYCTASPDTGGVVHEYDPQDLRNVLMSFKYSLTPQTFNSILQNTRGQYKIRLTTTEPDTEYKGWIEEVKYNHRTQEADIILKTSINTIGTAPQQGLNLPAYRFEFDMAAVTDQILNINYDNGTQNVAMAVDLNQSIALIRAAILNAAWVGFSVTDIIITRVSLGGARFRYKIIFVSPNLTVDIIDISGTPTISTFYYY